MLDHMTTISRPYPSDSPEDLQAIDRNVIKTHNGVLAVEMLL